MLTKDEGYEIEDGSNDEEETSGYDLGEWDALENEIDKTMKELTSENIKHLRAAIFEAKETETGKIPLHCDGINAPRKPDLIEDEYSAVLSKN